VTISGFTVIPVAGRRNWDKIIDVNPGTRHLTLDKINMDGQISGVRQVRDGLGISGQTDYVTVQNSDLHSIQDAKLIQIQTAGCSSSDTACYNKHLTLSRNLIHDDPQSNGNVHLECLWLEGISDFTLDGNHFYDCALNAILANPDEGGTESNWMISNNIFEAADLGAGGPDPISIDGCAQAIAKVNWVVQYNYFGLGGLALTGGGSICGNALSFLTMRGNIGADGDFTCPGSGTWQYNIWASRKCSATDTQNPNIGAAGNYLTPKTTGQTGPGDYRPSSPTAPQINAGDPTNYPTTDSTGTPRPLGGRPDAGPYEAY
jgi:hypothetical protein